MHENHRNRIIKQFIWFCQFMNVDNLSERVIYIYNIPSDYLSNQIIPYTTAHVSWCSCYVSHLCAFLSNDDVCVFSHHVEHARWV